MKKTRAVRSASETKLRANATSYLGHRSIKHRAGTAAAAARIADTLSGKKPTKAKPKKVSSTQEEIIDVEVVERGPSRQFVSSERTDTRRPGALPAGRKAPAALPAPKPAASKTKRGSKPKKERTPGTQTVFKATPAIDLREGPSFGKPTSIIEKTTQPKPSRTKKNA